MDSCIPKGNHNLMVAFKELARALNLKRTCVKQSLERHLILTGKTAHVNTNQSSQYGLVTEQNIKELPSPFAW